MMRNPRRKQAPVDRIKMLEWSMTLMNDLGFNLCVVPQSLVIRLVAYFRMEGSCQNRSPTINEADSWNKS